jgi:predicted unusual protein kinase regulating ubiquinone biosynthesis (AarF/ABC1/UbiB family)
MVEREFNIMRDLSKLDAVAQVAGEPLTDRDGVFGFRLERLYRIELEDMKLRVQEVQSLLDSLHTAGYCHGDPSFSNIMQNQEGTLVLIDLAFAGSLGSKIPEWLPEWLPKDVLSGDLYTTSIDQEIARGWVEHQERFVEHTSVG